MNEHASPSRFYDLDVLDEPFALMADMRRESPVARTVDPSVTMPSRGYCATRRRPTRCSASSGTIWCWGREMPFGATLLLHYDASNRDPDRRRNARTHVAFGLPGPRVGR